MGQKGNVRTEDVNSYIRIPVESTPLSHILGTCMQIVMFIDDIPKRYVTGWITVPTKYRDYFPPGKNDLGGPRCIRRTIRRI